MSTTTTTTSQTTLQTPKYLSPSCQQVISESFTQTTAHVLIRSALGDPKLWPSIDQHICNGTALVSSGHYADMGAVVGEYIWRAYRGANAELPGINVGHMEVTKTYIAQEPQPAEGQWLEMEAVLTVPDGSSGDIVDATTHCTFRKIKPDGKKVEDLATCIVQFEFYYNWLAEWSNHAGIIKSKIDTLYTRAQTESSGDVQLMYTRKAYELFKSFVDYGVKYQNMAEVVCDTKALEAASRLALQPDPTNDYLGPYYIDASCHVSGFVCNTADEDIAKNAYISHGFGAMKISPMFKPYPGADIVNYVHMKPLPSDDSVLDGDVYVLQDGQVVGVWEGVQFKKIPRRILNVFLPPRKR
jgi:iterative type I PKS product template protein